MAGKAHWLDYPWEIRCPRYQKALGGLLHEVAPSETEAVRLVAWWDSECGPGHRCCLKKQIRSPLSEGEQTND